LDDLFSRELWWRSTSWPIAQTGQDKIAQILVADLGGFGILELGGQANPAIAPLAHHSAIHLVLTGQFVIADPIGHGQHQQCANNQTVFRAALPGDFFNDLSRSL
jgi:hypothetical protein